jgi:hypothetical protein
LILKGSLKKMMSLYIVPFKEVNSLPVMIAR